MSVVATVEQSPSKLRICRRLSFPAICSVCRRTAGLWARFPRLDVRIGGHPENTIEYVWGDKTLRNLRCKVCGCNTHWEPLDSTQDYVGINMRSFEPAVLSSLPVRKFDGADTWTFID